MITKANGTDNLIINSHEEMINAKAKRKKDGSFAKERGMNKEAVIERVRKMTALMKELLANVHNLHVDLMEGNEKTGENCRTVSLIPGADCVNCSHCLGECYDVRNVCITDTVIYQRAKNSAIHKADPERYWKEISEQIKLLMVTELRLNVGGDFTNEDFFYIEKVAKENKSCDILFFTKNYDGLNAFLDKRNGRKPKNMQVIASVWEGMPFDNKWNVPCSHVLHNDGRTTAPEYGSVYCGGNCSACHYFKQGCWTLKRGDNVVFLYH